MIVVLVGNKTDLGDAKREVTTAQGEEEARRAGAIFVETSAKVGHNVKALFKRIAQALPGMERDGEPPGGQASKESPLPFLRSQALAERDLLVFSYLLIPPLLTLQ